MAPDEQGNLLPGDEGYVGPETTPDPIEEALPDVPEEQPIVDDETVESEEEPDVIEIPEESIVEEVELPADQNELAAPSGHNDFYNGSPVVDPEKPLLQHGDPLTYHSNLNRENR